MQENKRVCEQGIAVIFVRFNGQNIKTTCWLLISLLIQVRTTALLLAHKFV